MIETLCHGKALSGACPSCIRAYARHLLPACIATCSFERWAAARGLAQEVVPPGFSRTGAGSSALYVRRASNDQNFLEEVLNETEAMAVFSKERNKLAWDDAMDAALLALGAEIK